jgi:Lrp/AsnC family leucine-responsive transcriptional regulator
MSIKIDPIDLKILQKLQEDGRKTNLQLSQEIGLSPAPTLERVKKLEKNGVLQSFHAVVDESKLGIGINALIHVSVSHQIKDSLKNFKAQIMPLNQITECIQVTGSFDYQLRVKLKDIAAFDKFITEELSNIGGIRQMQTFVILSTIKNSKIIPVKY